MPVILSRKKGDDDDEAAGSGSSGVPGSAGGKLEAPTDDSLVAQAGSLFIARYVYHLVLFSTLRLGLTVSCVPGSLPLLLPTTWRFSSDNSDGCKSALSYLSVGNAR
jgi:hypothetical protein